LNQPTVENQPPNRSLGFHPFQVCTGTGASFFILSVISYYLSLINNLKIVVTQIEIILGYCKFREVSQQVRLGLRVIGSSPPPLNLLSSIIVKLLSHADQVPYWGGELAFWTGDTVIPNNRGF
jgi:hypothetical protein